MIRTYSALQDRLAALANQQGATAVEYGLIIAFIATVIFGAVVVFGEKVQGLFQYAVDCIVSKSC